MTSCPILSALILEIDVLSQSSGLTSNTISPLNSINAPTAIWGSSNANTPEIAIAGGNWEALPTTINTKYVNRQERIRVRHTTGTSPSTQYSTTINIGYGSSAGEYETSTFLTTTQDSIVFKPSITSPTNGETVNAETFVITGSAFSGQNAGTHESTVWQVANDSGFTDLIEVSTTTTDLESWAPTFGSTTSGSLVYARVKYIGSLNNVESEWSDTVQFTPVQWFIWQVVATLKGGAGYGTGSKGPGGPGGHAAITFTTTETRQSPEGTMSGTLGFMASGKNGASGYGSGGNSPNCPTTTMPMAVVDLVSFAC